MMGWYCDTADTKDTKIDFLFTITATKLGIDKFPDYLVTNMNNGLTFDFARACTGFVDYVNTRLGFPVTIRVFKK